MLYLSSDAHVSKTSRFGVEAKDTLYKLLSTVGKSNPNMASVYVMEYNEDGVLHFHVIFVFFRDEHLPCERGELAKEFGRYVFQCWNRLLGGNANRLANLMKIYQKSPKTSGYLAKKVRPVWSIPEYSTRKTRWWGIRNRKLFDKFGALPDREAAEKDFERILPRGVRRAYRRRKRCKKEFRNNSNGRFWNRYRRMRQLHPFGKRKASNRRSFPISGNSFHKPLPIYPGITNVRGVYRNARQIGGGDIFKKIWIDKRLNSARQGLASISSSGFLESLLHISAIRRRSSGYGKPQSMCVVRTGMPKIGESRK